MTKWKLIEYRTGERQYCHYNSNKYYVFENFYLMPEASFDEGIASGDIKILEEDIPVEFVITYISKTKWYNLRNVKQCL